MKGLRGVLRWFAERGVKTVAVIELEPREVPMLRELPLLRE